MDGTDVSDVKTTRRTHWRRIGLGLVMVATIGAAVYSQMPGRPANPVERLVQLHRRIVSLAEDDGLGLPLAAETSMALLDNEIDGEPDAMQIKWTFQRGDFEGPEEFMFIERVEEGKGEEFTEALRDLKAAILTVVGDMYGEEHRKMVDGLIEIMGVGEKDDTVEWKMLVGQMFPPKPDSPEGEAIADQRKLADEGEEDTKKPQLVASLDFGRDLDQMWDNDEESVATVHNGMKFTLSAKLAKRALAMLSEEFGFAMDETMKEGMYAMQAIASINDETTIKYRKEYLGELLPPLNVIAEMYRQQIRTMIPLSIREKIVALKGLGIGLEKMIVRGGLTTNVLDVEFTNFRDTPLLAEKLVDLEEPDLGFWPAGPAMDAEGPYGEGPMDAEGEAPAASPAPE